MILCPPKSGLTIEALEVDKRPTAPWLVSFHRLLLALISAAKPKAWCKQIRRRSIETAQAGNAQQSWTSCNILFSSVQGLRSAGLNATHLIHDCNWYVVWKDFGFFVKQKPYLCWPLSFFSPVLLIRCSDRDGTCLLGSSSQRQLRSSSVSAPLLYVKAFEWLNIWSLVIVLGGFIVDGFLLRFICSPVKVCLLSTRRPDWW